MNFVPCRETQDYSKALYHILVSQGFNSFSFSTKAFVPRMNRTGESSIHTTSISQRVEQISGSEDTAIKCIDSDEITYNFSKTNSSTILVGDIYRAAYRSGDGICYPRYDLGTNSESLVFAKHIFEQAF